MTMMSSSSSYVPTSSREVSSGRKSSVETASARSTGTTKNVRVSSATNSTSCEQKSSYWDA